MAEHKPASRLRLARVAKGFGVGELAEAINVAESTLYRIETGVIKEPSVKTRRALAKALGVRPEALFKVGK